MAGTGGGSTGGNGAAAVALAVMLDGKLVEQEHVQGAVIEKDMFQPDMASIVLMNQGDMYSTTKIGAPVEVKKGTEGPTLYKGQVVGLEPTYKGGQKTTIVIRCLHDLHKLLRMRKSRTWQDKKESEVLKTVASDAGLSLEFDGADLTYKHVYQHNQTDLEFLRVRASRIGAHIWCDDKKLMVKKPQLDQGGGVKLQVDGGESDTSLTQLTPRLSSTQIVKKVTVRGWNPETKKLITGEATVADSKLGSQTASAGSLDLGKEETFTVDHPIWGEEEAKALASGRLQELSLTYITGEAVLHGLSETTKLGTTVEVEANHAGADDPFNGRYYIMGVTYKNMPSMQDKASKKDVAQTILRLARDAQKR